MAVSTKKEMKKMLREIQGRVEDSTSLVSIGISWNSSKSSVSSMTVRELQTASNIKDKKTRRKVQKTLSKVIQYLKCLKVPQNGIFIFASYDGLWTVVPDNSLCRDFYECGKKFRVDELRELTGVKERIGIVNASIKITEISVKTGEFVDVVARLTSGIPSQHHKGGQSQGRFLRKRQEAIKEYANRIKQNMKSVQVEWWEYCGNKELVDMVR